MSIGMVNVVEVFGRVVKVCARIMVIIMIIITTTTVTCSFVYYSRAAHVKCIVVVFGNDTGAPVLCALLSVYIHGWVHVSKARRVVVTRKRLYAKRQWVTMIIILLLLLLLLSCNVDNVMWCEYDAAAEHVLLTVIATNGTISTSYSVFRLYWFFSIIL